MYKKSIGVLLILSMAFFLAACGSDEEKRVFEIDESGASITMTYYYEGDKVTKQTTKSTIPYESLGVTTEEEAKEILDPLSELFQGVEGIKEKIEYGDSGATETLEIDYEKVDLETAENLPGMMLDGDTDGHISMKQSAEMLLDQGFTEK